MNPTISLCIFSHNDLPMLKATLLHESRWVDQICILDMASTDGTGEFCHAWLRPGIDVYHRRETNTCPTLGFAEAKNAAMYMATSDWVLEAGADTVMDWHQTVHVRSILQRTQRDILSLTTRGVAPYKDCNPALIEEAVAQGKFAGSGRHRVFIRRGCGIEYKGYIHEEPYRGEVNCVGEAEMTTLQRYHFHGWGNDQLRKLRYGWMLNRAMQNPELQRWTNRWWYDIYCPEHADEIKQWSEEYELIKRA